MSRRRRREERPPAPLTLKLPILHAEPPVRLDGRPGASLRRVPLLPGEVRATIGPIPQPDTLLEYERIMPGLAERIVSWTEKEADHRRNVERSLLWLSWGGLWCAAAMAALSILGGMLLVWAGRSVAGLIGIVGAVAGLVVVFVAGRGRTPVDTADRPERAGRKPAAARA